MTDRKKYKYIPLIPKPLLNDFVENRVIPIVGAGFSKNADIPEGIVMPDWSELGRAVADEIPDYSYSNPIEAFSYYEELYSRTKLVELLLRELHYGVVTNPGDTYAAFCKLFTGIICTTNFDLLLETEMNNLGRSVSVIATSDRLSVGSKDEGRIIKLHGDFNHPNRMVITEKDYDTYIANNPILTTYVANLFITNTMLLVGYSLDDSDFRAIWQVINDRLGKMSQPAYCIMINASKDKIATYGRRNVKVINIESKDKNYKTILREIFVELKDYVDSERDKRVSSVDEKVNEQMAIPAEDNRLCFISCEQSRISRLSAMLHPMLRRKGVTPLRVEGMLMPGDNWVDIVSTAVRKSKAAIVDVSDSTDFVRQELVQTFSMKPKENVLLIGDLNAKSPPSLIGIEILHYCFDISDDLEEEYVEETQQIFERKLNEWIDRIYDNNDGENKEGEAEFAEAQRLLDKKEYTACVISAYSELEYRLSKLINLKQTRYRGRGHVNSISIYLHNDNISSDDRDVGKEFRFLRNSIVHNQRRAEKKEAVLYLEYARKAYKNAIEMEIKDEE